MSPLSREEDKGESIHLKIRSINHSYNGSAIKLDPHAASAEEQVANVKDTETNRILCFEIRAMTLHPSSIS